jgi:hypothetical protein
LDVPVTWQVVLRSGVTWTTTDTCVHRSRHLSNRHVLDVGHCTLVGRLHLARWVMPGVSCVPIVWNRILSGTLRTCEQHFGRRPIRPFPRVQLKKRPYCCCCCCCSFLGVFFSPFRWEEGWGVVTIFLNIFFRLLDQ